MSETDTKSEIPTFPSFLIPKSDAEKQAGIEQELYRKNVELLQKHLLFAFDSDFQNIFTVNGWSSSLWDERVGGEENINDF